MSHPSQQPPDVIVVGAGFGGLGCALSLCERGLRPLVLEALRYPGGCASTFKRDGYCFEAGATLFSGLSQTQLFGRWVKRYDLPIRFAWPDPVVELRTPRSRIPVLRDREHFIDTLMRSGTARGLSALRDERHVRRFFEFQREVADTLWPLLESPERMSSLNLDSVLHHGRGLARYARFVRWLGRPLRDVLQHFGVASHDAVRTWVRAFCQITVQCPPEEAEALVALSALDYAWRGTGHVVGGIGELASGLCDAIAQQGGAVKFAERVVRVTRQGTGFLVETTRGVYRARQVVGDVPPAAAAELLGHPAPEARSRAEMLHARVREGWGAAMLYAVVRPGNSVPEHAHHLELIADPERAFIEGNHVFVSVSGADELGRAPEGMRTVTMSSHVRVLPPAEQAAYVSRVQQRMRETVRALAPELFVDVVHELPASPRTFERFTRRPGGYVGGIPRRAGLAQYRELAPVELEPGFWLVGDSVFPGQSTFATATGGLRVAEAVAQRARANAVEEATYAPAP